ncbi:hypothetical protein ACFE04_004838 [Oxalis oulophora]
MNPGADYFGWDNIIDYNLFTEHDPSGNTLDVGLLDLCSPDNESIIEPSLFQVHADFPSDVATANVALPERECTRKRGRSESCSIPGTKACREKMRREKLNENSWFIRMLSFSNVEGFLILININCFFENGHLHQILERTISFGMSILGIDHYDWYPTDSGLKLGSRKKKYGVCLSFYS